MTETYAATIAASEDDPGELDLTLTHGRPADASGIVLTAPLPVAPSTRALMVAAEDELRRNGFQASGPWVATPSDSGERLCAPAVAISDADYLSALSEPRLSLVH